MNEIMCTTKAMVKSKHTVTKRTKGSHPPVRSKSMSHDTRKKLRRRCRRIADALRGIVFIYRFATVVLPTFADAKILYISSIFPNEEAKYFCTMVADKNLVMCRNFYFL